MAKTNVIKALFPMNLQFFAEEPEPGEKPDEGSGKQPEKTFTQAELDEIVAKRLERERKKYEKFADYDELKAKLAEYEKEREERQRAEMTEIERYKADYEKVTSEKQTLEQQLTELRESIKREKIVNEFIKVATALNVAYIDDALKLADLSAVTVDEDGVKGVKEAVEALVQHKPFLLAQAKKEPKTIGNPSNPNPNETAQKTAEQLLKEAEEKAKKSGRIEDVAAYSKLKRELGF
jgi:tRNA/tmRNA/rRNA uracil-C5-methylase (TrmA/RlmC/RlmD family)